MKNRFFFVFIIIGFLTFYYFSTNVIEHKIASLKNFIYRPHYQNINSIKKPNVRKKDKSVIELARKTLFNFQLLPIEQWQQSSEMNSVQNTPNLHYMRTYEFIPSQNSVLKNITIDGDLELGGTIKNHKPDMNFPYDSIPIDAFLEIGLGKDTLGKVVIRLSAFQWLKSGFFRVDENGYKTLSVFKQNNSIFPFFKKLHFKIVSKKKEIYCVVDGQTLKFKLKENLIGPITLLSGQWPIILDNFVVKDAAGTFSINKTKTINSVSEKNEFSTIFHNFDNPLQKSGENKRYKKKFVLNKTHLGNVKIFLFVIFVCLIISWILLKFLSISFKVSVFIALLSLFPFFTPSYILIKDSVFVLILDFFWFNFIIYFFSVIFAQQYFLSQRTEQENKVLFSIKREFLIITGSLFMLFLLGKSGIYTGFALILFLMFFLSFIIFTLSFQQRLNCKFCNPIIWFLLLIIFLNMWLVKLPSSIVVPYKKLVPPIKRLKVWPEFASRVRNYSEKKPRDKLRIICFGGSSTFGFPYQNGSITYSAQLEELLSHKLGSGRVEVINAGINGFTSFQIRKSLEDKFIRYYPDIIIVNCRFNDSTLSPRWYTSLPELTDQQAWSKLSTLSKLQFINKTQNILHHIFFYRFLKESIFSFRNQLFLSMKGKKMKLPRETVSEFRNNLIKIRQLSKKCHAKTIFIPEPNQYCNNLKITLSSNPYVKTMLKIAKEENIPFIDLMTPLSKRHDSYLFVDYIHPSFIGHKWIAKQIMKKITELDWL